MNTTNSFKCGQVDILLATYNGAKYIGELIDSIQNQTYQNWRLIVSDDGSTDDTLKIVQSRSENDGRILPPVLHQTTGHPKDNFFSLLSLVSEDADYIAFCDQDDVWCSDKLQTLIDCLDIASPSLAFSDLEVIDSAGNLVERSFMSLPSFNSRCFDLVTLAVQNSVPGCSMLLNRRLFELIRVPLSTKAIVMHDWWIMLIAAAFGCIKYVERQLVYYRRHGSNASGELSIGVIDGLVSMRKILCSHKLAQLQCLQFCVSYQDRMTNEQEALLRPYGMLNTMSRLRRLKVVKSGCFWRSSGSLARLAQALYLLTAKKQAIDELLSCCSSEFIGFGTQGDHGR